MSAEPRRRSLRRVALAVAPFAALAAALLVARHHRPERGPSPGDPAPDFALPRLEAGAPSTDLVRLSDLRGRPVALAFGSYT